MTCFDVISEDPVSHHRTIMTSLACAALAVMLGSSSVLAATKECRSIESRKDRNACYEQQKQTLAAKRAPTGSDNNKMIDAVEQMKQEDDLLAKRLQGICRGC